MQVLSFHSLGTAYIVTINDPFNKLHVFLAGLADSKKMVATRRKPLHAITQCQWVLTFIDLLFSILICSRQASMGLKYTICTVCAWLTHTMTCILYSNVYRWFFGVCCSIIFMFKHSSPKNEKFSSITCTVFIVVSVIV